MDRQHSRSSTSTISHSSESRVPNDNAQNAGDTPQSPPTLPVEPHPEPTEPLVSDTNQTQDPKPKQSTQKLISDFFVWETLAMLLSSGLMVAIVVILAQYDDRPQPTWRYVSLNSMISWLSTISKGCVLFTISEGIGQLKWVWFTRKSRPLVDLGTFDGASRGIYGCAGLLWRLRAKHFAALGSVAFILAIAFDPFVQNLIHYYPALIVDPSGTAMVSSNSLYDALGPPLNVATYYIDPAMKANVYNSLFNSDSSDPWAIPRYTCSSGNCTWDPITTLEMRASCTNITDQLKFQRNNSSTVVYLQGPKGNVSAEITSDTKLWGTPVVMAWEQPAFVYTDSIINPIQLIAPDNLPAEELWTDYEFAAPKWQAIECCVNPIVRSFRASVTRGIYHEETLAISTNGSFESLPLGSNYNFNPPWGPEMGAEPDKQFTLTKRSLTSIRDFFISFFPGQASLNPFGFEFGKTGVSTYASQDVMQLITLSNITGCTTRTAEKLHCAMDNVAKAMSKAIRDSNSTLTNLTTTTGQAMTTATHISIHWQWIALPVMVWLLGLITLLGTMWKTRRAGIPAWKNDTMPILSLYRNIEDLKLDDELLETDRIRLCESGGKIVVTMRS